MKPEVPQGRLKIGLKCLPLAQSSRWDDSFISSLPGDKSPGYSHVKPLRGISINKVSAYALPGEPWGAPAGQGLKETKTP